MDILADLIYSRTGYDVTSYFRSASIEVRKMAENAASDGFGTNFCGAAFCSILVHLLVGFLLNITSASVQTVEAARRYHIHRNRLGPNSRSRLELNSMNLCYNRPFARSGTTRLVTSCNWPQHLIRWFLSWFPSPKWQRNDINYVYIISLLLYLNS